MSEDPALEIRAQLALDESRRRTVSLSGPREKGLELRADYLVEDALLRMPVLVAQRTRGGERAGEDGGRKLFGRQGRARLRVPYPGPRNLWSGLALPEAATGNGRSPLDREGSFTRRGLVCVL